MHRIGPGFWLILSAAFIFSIGILMVFNTTSAEVIDRALAVSEHAALLRQILYGCVGICLGLGLYKIGYQRILDWGIPSLAFVSLLLVLVFIPGIGQEVNGSRRWLRLIGGYTFQPSECAKIFVPVAYIQWYLKQKGPIDFRAFLKVLFFLSIPIALILLEPDNGTTILLFLLLGVLFLLSKIRWRYWALPLLLLGLIGGGIGYQLPYVQHRIQVYLHPELDLKGKGHQPHQAKIAAGSGQLWGRGIGESLQKLNYLPEARNDYIAAIYAEETGFIGMLWLIGLYAVFTFSGLAICLKARDQGGFLLASTLTFLIAIQAFLNLGIVSGLLPSKGMTLPFFSQGGSSLIVNIMALFMILDIGTQHHPIYEK